MNKHPLAHFVLQIYDAGQMIDVTTLSVALSGVSQFTGPHADLGTKSYRVVAADVLGWCADNGLLRMKGTWSDEANKFKGGPSFEFINFPPPKHAITALVEGLLQ